MSHSQHSPQPDVPPNISTFAGSSSPRPRLRNNIDESRQFPAENIESAPPAVHAASQPSVATTIDSTSITDHECLVTSPSQIGRSYDTPLTNALHTLSLNRPPQSSIFNQSPQHHCSVPQPHYEERDSVHQSSQPERDALTLSQATQPHVSTSISHQRPQSYPTPSVNMHYSVGLQQPAEQGLYHSHRPIMQNPQVEDTSHLSALSEQQYSASQSPHQPSNRRLSHLKHRNPGLFDQAHDFVINNSVFVDNSSNNFMASFLEETIIGAEFDSSDRNMPLRCHPGTRLKIIKRCQDFVLDRDGRPKLRWVVGVAGVGKSAIMQSIAHDVSNILSDIIVGATIFFSIDGRDDGTKAITTIAYQLAVKLDSYRLFIQREITRDPSLYRKSLSRQFDKFIVQPFIHERIVDGSSQLLIIIDGLDECANPLTQRELLGLISDFCITYPASPLVWIVASRPEPHITSFFSQPKVALSYEKEEVLVNSDEAWEDVKRYLRDEFRGVQMASITLQELPEWPSEGDFLKVANASGGLFAYASTVVRYISDPDYGDPVPLLDDVLEIIETGTKENIWGRNHPMAQLDALYSRIMSKIPANVMENTRKLLLLSLEHMRGTSSFHFYSNMLGMTQNAAYGATHHIRSVALAPRPVEAVYPGRGLQFFHKSFPDYLCDFQRSGFSTNLVSEVEELWNQCALRVLEEAPDGVYVDGINEVSLKLAGGLLKNFPRAGGRVSLSWLGKEEHNNQETQLIMFHQAIWAALSGLREGKEGFQSLICIRVLTTCFTKLPVSFPLDAMRDFTFDESRRRELLDHGILKQVPLETLGYDPIVISHRIRLRFKGLTVERSNPWNILCQHEREGSWEGHSQDWSTKFKCPILGKYSRYNCSECFLRFTRHFLARSGGHLVTVLGLTPTLRMVELQFVDPDDGVSTWIYHFFMGRDDQNYHDDEEDEDGGDID